MRSFASLSAPCRRTIAIVAGVLALAAIALSAYYLLAGRVVPELLGGSFDLESRIIPANADFVEFAFSTALDPTSVSAASVSVSPALTGSVSAHGSRIRYSFSEPLSVGDVYAFTLAAGIRSDRGAESASARTVELRVVSGARVLGVIPSERLTEVSRNIVAMFSVPMVALGSVDARESLPCPIAVEPAVPGRCVWTSSTVAEFEPERGFDYASEYRVTVASASGMLYELASSRTGSFSTPAISLSTSDEFDPKTGIVLLSNAPLDPEALRAKATIRTLGKHIRGDSGLAAKPDEFIVLPVRVVETDSSHTRFTLAPEKGSFAYDAPYDLQVAEGLQPERGNVPMVTLYSHAVRSAPLVTDAMSVLPVTVVDSETREERTEPDARYLSARDGAEWADRTIHPQAEASLLLQISRTGSGNSTIRLERTGSGSALDVPIRTEELSYLRYLAESGQSYRLEELQRGMESGSQSSRKAVEDMESTYRFVRVRHARALDAGAQYSLVFPQDGYALGLRAAGPARVMSFAAVDYTTACLTVSESLRPSRLRDNVYDTDLTGSLVSSGASASVRLYEVSQWWGDHPCIRHLSESQKNEPVVRYAIDMKPLPRTEYSFRLADASTSYAVPMAPYASPGFPTGDVPESAKLVEFGNWNGYQSMPADVDFRIGVQTRNVDTYIIQACRLPVDPVAARQGLTVPRYRELCGRSPRITRSVKNNHWATTYSVTDIEKDVLGAKSGLYTLVLVGTPGQFAELDRADADAAVTPRWTVYMRSDLALSYEGAGTSTDILSLSRLDGSPIAEGASWRFYADGREVSGVSARPMPGVPGVYSIARADGAPTAIGHVVATVGDAAVGLDLTGDAFGNSDFDAFSWNTVSARDFIFFHPDRPLYRPGDTVYFRGIARTFDPRSGYRPYSSDRLLRVSYTDTNGTASTQSLDVRADARGNFSGSFIVPADAKLGRNAFSAVPVDAESSGMSLQGEFFVEEYKKPLFKTVVEADGTSALYGDKVSVSAHGEYYFGGTLKWARYQYDVLSQRAFIDRGIYSDYVFGTDSWWHDDGASYGDSMEYSDTGVVGDDGFVRREFVYPVPARQGDDQDAPNTPEIRAYTQRFSLVDPASDQSVSSSATQVVYPTDVSVGLRPSAYFLGAGETFDVAGIVLDHDSRPVSGKSVSLELVRTDWKRVKKQGVDGVDYYDYSEVRTVEASGSVSSAADGAFARKFAMKSAGSYEVRATYHGANGLASVAALHIYATGPEMVYWADGNSSVSDLLADKREYRPGETAVLHFQAPIATGSLLVTVEKDDAILSTFTLPVTSSLVPVRVPIVAEYLPNVYVKVLFVGRADSAGLPIVARGLANLAVLTGDKKLAVTVSTDRRYYAPQDSATVSVRVADSSGKPVAGAAGSLAVVDESLLALVGNPTLDPYGFFYRLERYLGVSTASSLANLIKKLEIPDASDGEKWGGGMTGEARRLRGDFRDTAYWTAEYVTDAQGVATIQVPHLPDNLTDWRIETVVDSLDRVGVGYAVASTRRPVMLASNLPNFLTESDRIVLKPVVSNRTAEAREFTVTLSSSAFASGSTLVRSVRVRPGEDSAVEFPVVIKSLRELGRISSAEVSLEMVDSTDSSMRDGERLPLPIAASTMPEVTTTFGLMSGGVSADERIALSPREKDGVLRVTYSPSVYSFASPSFGFFSVYPYGCAEQITSSILPHVYEKRLSDAIGIPLDPKLHTIESYDRLVQASVRTTVDAALHGYLSSIRGYQNSDGGLRYWQDSPGESSYWLTAYVLDGLMETASIGYAADTGMTDRMAAYLSTEFDADLARHVTSATGADSLGSSPRPKYSLDQHFEAVRALARYDVASGKRESVGRFEALVAESERRYGPMEERPLLEREIFLRTLASVARAPGVTASAKDRLQERARAMTETIFSDSLVINTRGAFLAEKSDDSKYARLDRTLRFVDIAAVSGAAERADIGEILPRMLRWAASQADADGSYGTTMLTAEAVRVFADYLASSGELADVDMAVKLLVNGQVRDSKTVNAENKLSANSVNIDLATLPDVSDVRFERSGSGGLAYDLSLERRVSMRDADAKSYGFHVERAYYDAAEYDRVRAAKSAEWERYARGEIDSSELRYPEDVTRYLTSIDRIPVSGLVYARYRLVLPEARDFVAFEAPVPSGTMLVNPRLATDAGGKTLLSNPIFSYEEYRLDRYFGFAESLGAGEYEVGFYLRATHRGEFFVPVARALEFYAPESFGRTAGGVLTIE